LNSLPIWGYGIGSYEYLFAFYSAHIDVLSQRVIYAHNEPLQLIFELGVGAIPLMIAVCILLMVKDNNRYVLICFVIIAMLSFPLRIPAMAFIGAVVCGHLARKREPIFNLMASRLAYCGGVFWYPGHCGGPTIPQRMETTV
jgi:hypothetical protein